MAEAADRLERAKRIQKSEQSRRIGQQLLLPASLGAETQGEERKETLRAKLKILERENSVRADKEQDQTN